MKKTLSIVAVYLIVLSTFSMLAPQILAEHDITSASIQPLETEYSEPPETQWNRTYGGTNDDLVVGGGGRCMIQTSDGGYALAGYTESLGAGARDFWLVKTYPNGTMQWNKTYGGTNDDFAQSVIQTSDGGYALLGPTHSFGAGLYDAWLVKTDESGNMLWNRTYGGTNWESADCVIQTSDGGYALACSTKSFGHGDFDAWLIKTNSTGDTEWSQTYGGGGMETGRSVVQTNDEGYAIVGGATSFGGSRQFYLVKTNSTGDEQWSRTYGGVNQDSAWCVVETSDGGYALAGRTESFGYGKPDNPDFYLVKTNSTGDKQWSQTYGGTDYEWAYCVIQTSDGGYAVAGETESLGAGSRDAWLVKTYANGTVQWNKTYGGPNDDDVRSVVQTSDRGYALAGGTESFGAGSWDFWLIKLAPPVERVLLGTGWGWMRIDCNESVCGRAELYKIGDEQIELTITSEGETYSRTWNIILHEEHKFDERYVCYSSEWGFLIVRLHRHRRCQFWYAVGRGVAAFGFPNLGTLKLTPTPG